MGNVLSSAPTNRRDVTGESDSMASSEDGEEFHDSIDDIDPDQDARSKAKEAKMEEFRQQLEVKREQRREILDRHRTEKKELETSLENERKARLEAYETNRMLRELLIKNNIEIPKDLQCTKENSEITETIETMKVEFEKLRDSNIKLRRDLAEANRALQAAYSDIADLQEQNTESIKHINALKEVISVSKTMLNLREGQLNELKNKLSDIERSLADREASMLSADLRQEYERQLLNIRNLRGLYEERARLAEVTRQGLVREVEEQKALKQIEINKVNDLAAKVEQLETQLSELQETISNKNNQIYTCQDETRGLKAEMSAVNKLFSQVLLGYKSPQDLDKLVHRLEEHHGILTHMAEKENDSEASTALPKLLLEIVSQVDEEEDEQENILKNEETNGENSEAQCPTNTSAEEIVQNLPKVWRVLIELLSHQTAPDDNAAEKVTTCYKTVETKSGPVQVPSVSQTYIRLKDLIVEKLSLIKEVNRMKQLNGHLESRLEEQERRLCLVTNELSKTWHVVGRLRRHHHQLHTHEKILKYELQQKRKLLNELKEELEFCREKWEQAREKNTQSEKDWKKLRAEFSSRKNKSSASINNSAESGYSDERPSDESSESNDESENVTNSLIRSKKKLKKSFETILDSSADFNLVAEREDPASDMLDVADLSLDTQDGDEHNISDSCNSESLPKSEKVCEETEDEVCDIGHDSCTEEATVDHCDLKQSKPSGSKIPPVSVPGIDPASILKSIREQNERLARKDKKLESLEKTGATLLLKTQATVKLSEQINSTLDHLLNRPTSSRQSDLEIDKTKDFTKNNQNRKCENKIAENEEADPKEDVTISANEPSTSTSHESVVDFKQILENVRLQNERLTKKDERLAKLENDCTAVASCISKTLSTGEEIIKKIDRIHNEEIGEIKHLEVIDENSNPKENEVNITESLTSAVNSEAIPDCVSLQNESIVETEERTQSLENNALQTLEEISVDTENSVTENKSDFVTESLSRDSSEPSTSSEMDHEARFAARDLRLKRLEEQTKSLVNKVNKTTSKGVKIHYKLEELHNIYGSENSRAGTPSDSEEKSSEDKLVDDTSNSEPGPSNDE